MPRQSALSFHAMAVLLSTTNHVPGMNPTFEPSFDRGRKRHQALSSVIMYLHVSISIQTKTKKQRNLNDKVTLLVLKEMYFSILSFSLSLSIYVYIHIYNTYTYTYVIDIYIYITYYIFHNSSRPLRLLCYSACEPGANWCCLCLQSHACLGRL